MITSVKIKLWTMITHGLIVVGLGHGILFFFVLEVVWFASMGYLIAIGQLCILASMFLKPGLLKIASHILGLLLLWTSVVCFISYVSEKPYDHFGGLTAIPFVVCTVLTLVGDYLRRFRSWIWEKM